MIGSGRAGRYRRMKREESDRRRRLTFSPSVVIFFPKEVGEWESKEKRSRRREVQ